MRSPLLSGLDHALYGLVKTHAPRGHGPRQAWAIARFVQHHQAPIPFLIALTGADAGAAREALREARAALAAFPWPQKRGGQVSPADWCLLYAVTRLLRHCVVVETGTGSGASTAAIAAAVKANHGGMVVSIDVPPESTQRGADGVPYRVPNGEVPGWAVPPHLRGWVHFVLEDARTALPHWLRHLGTVGLVFLDDDHTPQHVQEETLAALHATEPGAVVLCDDANYGWADAMRHEGRSPYLNCGMLAGCRKP